MNFLKEVMRAEPLPSPVVVSGGFCRARFCASRSAEAHALAGPQLPSCSDIVDGAPRAIGQVHTRPRDIDDLPGFVEPLEPKRVWPHESPPIPANPVVEPQALRIHDRFWAIDTEPRLLNDFAGDRPIGGSVKREASSQRHGRQPKKDELPTIEILRLLLTLHAKTPRPCADPYATVTRGLSPIP